MPRCLLNVVTEVVVRITGFGDVTSILIVVTEVVIRFTGFRVVTSPIERGH